MESRFWVVVAEKRQVIAVVVWEALADCNSVPLSEPLSEFFSCSLSTNNVLYRRDANFSSELLGSLHSSSSMARMPGDERWKR